jgi:translation initiation factor 2B subunit (eIF-2B alpha/beta/delta family)
MWWLVAKKSLEKAFLWCKHHWKAVLLVVAFGAVYLLGRNKHNNLLNMAKNELKLYKEKTAKIEESHQQHVEDVKKAKVKYDETVKKADKQFEKFKTVQTEKKKKEVKRLLKKAKNNPDELDKILEREFGIKEV